MKIINNFFNTPTSAVKFGLDYGITICTFEKKVMIFDEHFAGDYWRCKFLDYKLVGDARTGHFNVSRFLAKKKFNLWLADDVVQRLVQIYGEPYENEDGTFAKEEFLFSAAHWHSHDPSTIEVYENDVAFRHDPKDRKLHGVLVVLKKNAPECEYPYHLLRTQRQSVKPAIKRICCKFPRTEVIYATRHYNPIYFMNWLHKFRRVQIQGNNLRLYYPEDEFLRDLRAAVALDISQYVERRN